MIVIKNEKFSLLSFHTHTKMSYERIVNARSAECAYIAFFRYTASYNDEIYVDICLDFL